MARVLVLFHSRTGATATLAEAIAEGARSVRFTEVDVRRLAEPVAGAGDAGAGDAGGATTRPRHHALDDVRALAEYDALVLGSPAGEGADAAPLARFRDELASLGGTLADVVGAAFATRPPDRGGHEPTLLSMLAAMAAAGMLLVPPGRTGAGPEGSPFGITTAGEPTEADLAAARQLGARVAKVAGWVRHAKGHEHGHGHGGGEGHHHHH